MSKKIETQNDKLYEVIIKLPSKISNRKDKEYDILLENITNIKFIDLKNAVNFSMEFNSTEAVKQLTEWYEHVMSGAYKYDSVGDIIVTQISKEGLVIRIIKFITTQIRSLENNEDTMIAEFIADYYVDEYVDSAILVGPTVKNNFGFTKISDKIYSKFTTPNSEPGYHLTKFPKGKLGSISKIEEELNELKDAEKQNSKIMMLIELADLYGAIEEFCKTQNMTMEDLKTFSDITKRAFKNGYRN